MQAFMKKVHTAYGYDNAMIIEYDSESELEDFISICTECRKQAVAILKEDGRYSQLDRFLQLLLERKRDFVKFSENNRVVQTSMIFSSEFPVMFYGMFEALGMYACLFDESVMKNDVIINQYELIDKMTKTQESMEKSIGMMKQMLAMMGVGQTEFDNFTVDKTVDVKAKPKAVSNDMSVGVIDD